MFISQISGIKSRMCFYTLRSRKKCLKHNPLFFVFVAVLVVVVVTSVSRPLNILYLRSQVLSRTWLNCVVCDSRIAHLPRELTCLRQVLACV